MMTSTPLSGNDLCARQCMVMVLLSRLMMIWAKESLPRINNSSSFNAPAIKCPSLKKCEVTLPCSFCHGHHNNHPWPSGQGSKLWEPGSLSLGLMTSPWLPGCEEHAGGWAQRQVQVAPIPPGDCFRWFLINKYLTTSRAQYSAVTQQSHWIATSVSQPSERTHVSGRNQLLLDLN